MKVRELIKLLTDYNPDAEVKVLAHNIEHDFSLLYRGCEGATKQNCADVSLNAIGLNEHEIE